MNAFPKIDTMEALRLTRDGRLQEALAVLSGGLPSAAPSNSEGDGPRRPARRTRNHSGHGAAAIRNRRCLDGTPVQHGAFSGSSRSHDPVRRCRRHCAGSWTGSGNSAHVDGIDGLVGPAVGRAPAPLPDGARFEERTYANEAGSRAYKLYVPSSYTGQALPLVVMLHGCTQSPDDFAAGTQMNELAEEKTFLVAYPAQPKSANMSKCWNWFNESDQQRDRGEPSLIAGITRQIMRDFPVEPGRVFIAGLSAGGAAAAIMGSTYPDLYAAIGVHSGLACGAARDMPSAFAAMRQGGMPVAAGSRESDRGVPTIVFHGDRDTTVSPVNGDQVIAQAKAASNLRTSVSHGEAVGGIGYTRTVQADESGRPMLEQWVLHGAGHAWSGGSADRVVYGATRA